MDYIKLNTKRNKKPKNNDTSPSVIDRWTKKQMKKSKELLRDKTRKQTTKYKYYQDEIDETDETDNMSYDDTNTNIE